MLKKIPNSKSLVGRPKLGGLYQSVPPWENRIRLTHI